VEHPTGEFTVVLGMNPENPSEVMHAALLRTARLIMRGEVYAQSMREPLAKAGLKCYEDEAALAKESEK
jgi:hypothetical protein